MEQFQHEENKEQREKEVKVLIIIPAYNEEENIADVVEHLPSQLMAGILDARLSVD